MTEFSTILEAFLSRTPGARSAALVDSEGETVDYAGETDPFVVRVAAAHFRIVLEVVLSRPALTDATSIVVRASRQSFLVHSVSKGYALLVQFVRGAGMAGWQRPLAVCTGSLASEAGWPAPKPAWFPVEIACAGGHGRLRPTALLAGRTEERALEVLGAVASGITRREKAWRVRLGSGAEATVVREPGGRWYADEPLVEPTTAGLPGRERSEQANKNH